MGWDGGHMHDRQRCGKKCESVIPYSYYAKYLMDGWFVISFIDVPVKNSKPLKP